MRRRTYLAAAVACATPLIAGCSDPGGGDGGGGGDDENDGGGGGGGGGGIYGRGAGDDPAALGPTSGE